MKSTKLQQLVYQCYDRKMSVSQTVEYLKSSACPNQVTVSKKYVQTLFKQFAGGTKPVVSLQESVPLPGLEIPDDYPSADVDLRPVEDIISPDVSFELNSAAYEAINSVSSASSPSSAAPSIRPPLISSSSSQCRLHPPAPSSTPVSSSPRFPLRLCPTPTQIFSSPPLPSSHTPLLPSPATPSLAPHSIFVSSNPSFFVVPNFQLPSTSAPSAPPLSSPLVPSSLSTDLGALEAVDASSALKSMNRFQKRTLLLHFFVEKKGNLSEAVDHLNSIYGDGAFTKTMASRWFKKFSKKEYNLKDAPKSGKPVKVTDEQLQNYINENPDALARDMAQHFRVSAWTIYRRMKKLGYSLKLDQSF